VGDRDPVRELRRTAQALESCLPAPALKRLAEIHGAVDPDRLLVASHAVS
jgi:hypothetical protein